MTVNFMYNGIKIGGKLYKANYRFSGYTPGNGLVGTTITMYGCYKKMPRLDGLTIIENKKDSMTNRVRIAENDQYYNEEKKGLGLSMK
jgi:hypothetical protein